MDIETEIQKPRLWVEQWKDKEEKTQRDQIDHLAVAVSFFPDVTEQYFPSSLSYFVC